MTNLQWIDERPIREKLEKELKKHAIELVELEATIDEYFSKDLPQYQSWVNYHFADELLQMNVLEKKVVSFGNHIEESIQLSMEMKLHPSELFAGWSEEQILDKILQEEAQKPDEELNLEGSSSSSEPASDEAREIYRRIARCLHPDLRQDAVGEVEKNLWVKAQSAYGKNDVFELQRIEQNIRCGNLEAEPITCSELIRQLEDFRKRHIALQEELKCLSKERAWKFSGRKSMANIEKELQSEFRSTLKDLKSRETYLHKTLSSWVKDTAPPEANSKLRKRTHKSQVSLF